MAARFLKIRPNGNLPAGQTEGTRKRFGRRLKSSAQHRSMRRIARAQPKRQIDLAKIRAAQQKTEVPPFHVFAYRRNIDLAEPRLFYFYDLRPHNMLEVQKEQPAVYSHAAKGDGQPEKLFPPLLIFQADFKFSEKHQPQQREQTKKYPHISPPQW
ncbi:hypothetical protein AALG83_01905 [Christensenellaceae bacterium 44-20]